MPLFDPNAIPTQLVNLPSLERQNIKLLLKRLDLVHPFISGNKFYKLKYNLEKAKSENHHTVLTFGGAFSNHIQATAVAAKLSEIKSIGIIRGEKPKKLNPTLERALENGMELYFISRESYRMKADPIFLESLKERFGDFFHIPEGGTNDLAIQGTSEILTEEDLRADIIATSIGTGGTLAGLVKAAKKHQQVWGFSALKGDFMGEEFRNLLNAQVINHSCEYTIFTDYHFGGYAKHNKVLLEFIEYFYRSFGIPLDPIYTGKMLYGVLDQCEGLENKTILCLHTGGLQGIKGFNQRFGTDLKDR
ncbi:pyridoxal-phosphate dependent enzyme [Litoribacter ruber]|uniref:1-aminocyclopropane-1-carboxylate deaminase/D-cysteine desulfhydrase n=1 Tax=Litoribacter ruber TaxID=702568 RepID=UPI001BDA70B5|nr:pyridoxal-phosphate dependent enzyme [Litoribacter ruber]MBT0809963.1 pyridoxal-phosphate dependent enzyme [Litoribacter ruber]